MALADLNLATMWTGAAVASPDLATRVKSSALAAQLIAEVLERVATLPLSPHERNIVLAKVRKLREELERDNEATKPFSNSGHWL